MNLQDITKQLLAAKHVLISAHTNPDGDAIGAMVTIGHFLAAHAIPYMILLEETDAQWAFLLQTVHTGNVYEGPVDTMLALDCGDTTRLVGYDTYFTQARCTLAIDHHQTNTHYAAANYVVPQAAATCELVYDLITLSGTPVTRAMAEGLYTGIVTDTGGFMYPSTSPHTMTVAAELMKTGIAFDKLYYQLIHQKSLDTVTLQSIAVGHLKCIQEGVYFTTITGDEINRVGATKQALDGVVSYLKNISGTQMIALLYPLHKGSGYKLSTRSNEPYDVAMFCQQFGGGGHMRAAGASLHMTFDEACERVISALEAL